MFSASELSSEEVVIMWLVLLEVVLEVLLVVVVTVSNCTAEGWRDMMASPN